jgi:hypothetical protein
MLQTLPTGPLTCKQPFKKEMYIMHGATVSSYRLCIKSTSNDTFDSEKGKCSSKQVNRYPIDVFRVISSNAV